VIVLVSTAWADGFVIAVGEKDVFVTGQVACTTGVKGRWRKAVNVRKLYARVRSRDRDLFPKD